MTASPLFVGAQAIVGLELDFVDVPLDFVVEYRPGIGILVGDQGGLGFNPIGVGAHIRVWL